MSEPPGDPDKPASQGPSGQATTPTQPAVAGQREQPADQADNHEKVGAGFLRPRLQAIGHWAWSRTKRSKLSDWALIALTAVLALTAISSDHAFHAQLDVMAGQLAEMKSSSADSHNLVVATQNLATVAGKQESDTQGLVQAGKDQATAAKDQAGSMDKLKAAGELQATAAESLAAAGRSQADSTAALATATGRQLAAIQAQADAAHSQALAVGRQADATLSAGQSTDRLAAAGQAQSAAVLQSLATAKEANQIAREGSAANNRPWVSIQAPIGEHELSAGADYGVDLNISNPGRSPATNVQYWQQIQFLPITGAIGDLDACPACARITLFPEVGFGSVHQNFHATIPKDQITPAHLAAYQNFTEIILIRSRADYTDSAGSAHHSFSCIYYVPKAKGLGSFTSCLHGNNAD